MVWWALFFAELVTLLVVAVQWRLAARRGREGWLGKIAERLAAAAEPAGAARLAADPRLPHSEKANRRVQHYGWLAFGALISLPAFAAVAINHLSIQLAVGAWFLALYCCIDVAVTTLVVLMLWLGWMPPFDDGGGGDELIDPAPRPDGPWARAHVFDLKR